MNDSETVDIQDRPNKMHSAPRKQKFEDSFMYSDARRRSNSDTNRKEDDEFYRFDHSS